MSLRIVLHRKIPDDAMLRRQWNNIVLLMERPEVFYTYEWAAAMQSSYEGLLKPLLFLGYDGDDLIGVASLATDDAEEGVSFLAGTTGDYCDFLSLPQQRSEFVEAVFAEIGKTDWDFTALASLPENSATADVLPVAEKQGFHVYERPACLCAQIELGSTEQRQKLKAALMSYRKFRRYILAMEREAPVTFVHLQSQAEIQAALPVFADAHVARFRETQRTSFLSTPERRHFLAELARQLSGTDVVTLSMLRIGDRPVAWVYGFQFHGSWFIYQATFDSRQLDHSPGHCLLSRIVSEACDMEGMDLVDLGLGAEGYKERFVNSTRQTIYVTLTKSLPRHLREVGRYRAASILKRSPKVESAVRRVLCRLGRY
jgi:CelD/BcsL family acetyltransferase involved in cellulose biosynthesis